MKKYHQNNISGFALPTIVLLSLSLIVIAMSSLQSVTSIRDSLTDQYIDRLAKEAAEAGVTYANYCLTLNGFVQTWGPLVSQPSLTQTTDCNGAAKSPAVPNLIANSILRSTFRVDDLEVRNDGAIVISSTGTTDVLRAGTTVVRSYTKVLKKLVVWKEYKASISASGTSKTCAVISNELYCWGKNSDGTENFSGQLGDGTNTDSLVPVKVVQDAGVLAGKVIDSVVSAQFHNCALATGKVYCWGINNRGQLGNGTITNSSVPVEVTGALAGKTVTAIAASGNTSCAIAAGKIYCWGLNSFGSVGANTAQFRYLTPTPVAATGTSTTLPTTYIATALSSSGSRSQNMCAIIDASGVGKAYCWGENEAGQIGNNTSGATNVTLPTKVIDTGALSGKSVTSISQDGYYSGSYTPSYAHVCAVASGAVYCWGDNVSGQLGINSTTDSSVPVAVSTSGVLSGKTVQDVVVGLQHSCALANSKVYCWGNNGGGQLGNSSNTTSLIPVAVSELTGGLLGKTITAIGGGANRGCAVASYQVFCWGVNSDGQIGDGTQIDRNVPTESIFLQPKAPAFIF
jgi:alpha-tubulin suppressor-like RCC1 family protein